MRRLSRCFAAGRHHAIPTHSLNADSTDEQRIGADQRITAVTGHAYLRQSVVHLRNLRQEKVVVTEFRETRREFQEGVGLIANAYDTLRRVCGGQRFASLGDKAFRRGTMIRKLK